MKFYVAVLMVVISQNIYADTIKQKYKRNDCITPINQLYSWYGMFAKVEAFSRIDGLTKNKSYILTFPFNGSNNSIFTKEIESNTKKVSDSKCYI